MEALSLMDFGVGKCAIWHSIEKEPPLRMKDGSLKTHAVVQHVVQQVVRGKPGYLKRSRPMPPFLLEAYSMSA